ncbi:MAG TPA: cyclic nucleotide-binding domain-containing protein, partial [Acetobacteraceae bacterium]|nr:cyclic nucleotide-binding domain-containing protein [Acetobacteraceae bacterium]
MAKPEHDARRTALLGSPLFQAMQPEELNEILSLALERRFKRGQTIFQKDDSGSSMMAVLRGLVRISVVSAEGKEITLNVIR